MRQQGTRRRGDENARIKDFVDYPDHLNARFMPFVLYHRAPWARAYQRPPDDDWDNDWWINPVGTPGGFGAGPSRRNPGLDMEVEIAQGIGRATRSHVGSDSTAKPGSPNG